MANERKPISAGFDRIHYGVIDSDGYLIGSTTTAPTGGNQTGSTMARLSGAKSAPITVLEPESVVATGDDSALAKFLFQAADLPAGVIEAAVQDLTFDALAQGTAVADIGDLSVGVLQPENPVFQDMTLLLQRQAKSYTSGSRGAKRVSGLIASFVNITPLGTDSFTERQVATARYGYTLSAFDRLPFGSVVNTTDFGTQRGVAFPFTADNYTIMQRWTGNGTEDEFTLSNTPISISKIRVWIDGVKKTPTSDYTLSGSTLVMGSAPSNNAKIIAWYETSD